MAYSTNDNRTEAVRADQERADGTNDFSGGSNAGVDPSLLPPNQFEAGINISTTKGILSPRWGYIKKKLDFSNAGVLKFDSINNISFENIFRQGRFQALIPYYINGEYYVIYIVSGYLFLINQTTFVVQVLNPDDPLNDKTPRLNHSAASRYLVIFDFPNNAAIIAGIEFRRANPSDNEVPISVMGVYNERRLFIVNALNEFTAGDPTGAVGRPKAPITFFEINQSSSDFVDQIFQMPTDYNALPITYIGFLETIDTSTGIGPVIVSTPRNIYSFRGDKPRIQWTDGFGSVFLSKTGIKGPRAAVNVNGDLFFIGTDNQIRSASMSRDEQSRWSKTGISREVEQFLTVREEDLNSVAFASSFQNNIFFAANPYRLNCRDVRGNIESDYAFGGVVVIETDNVSGLAKTATPVWGGLWTGTRPLDMAVNNNMCFMAGKEGETNQLYVLDPKLTYDVDEVLGINKDIKSRIRTKGFDHQAPINIKRFNSLSAGLRGMEGVVNIDVSYKPDYAANYTYWRNFTHIAPYRQCEAFPQFPLGLAKHALMDVDLGSIPDDDCEPVNKIFTDAYNYMQFEIDITGRNWEMHYLVLNARILPTTNDVDCVNLEEIWVPKKCNSDWRL